MSPTTRRAPASRRKRDSLGGRRVERRVEGVGPRERRVEVEAQAVDLHDPGVALPRLPLDGRGEGEVEQPPRRRGANDDPHVGCGEVEGVQDLDVARRVPEAVARDVEDDAGRRGHPPIIRNFDRDPSGARLAPRDRDRAPGPDPPALYDEPRMSRRVLLAVGFFLALAVVLTWPAAIRIGSGIPADAGDPLLNTWIFWWNAHAVPLTAAWWNAPAFHPADGVLAFSEHLLGFAWITSPLIWAGVTPLAAYTVAFIVLVPDRRPRRLVARSRADRPRRCRDPGRDRVCGRPLPRGAGLARAGAHGLLDAGGAGRPAPLPRHAAAPVAGALRRRVARAGPLQRLLPRVLRPGRRRLAGVLRVPDAADGARRGAIVAASAGVAAAMLPFLVEYQAVHERFGFRRMPSEIATFSADVLALFDASPRLLLWGRMQAFHKAEGELFPGLAILVLVAAGVAVASRSAPAARHPHPPRGGRWPRSPSPSRCSCSYGIYGRWRFDLVGMRVSMLNPRRPTVVVLLAMATLVATWPGLAAAWRRRSPLLFYTLACRPAVRPRARSVADARRHLARLDRSLRAAAAAAGVLRPARARTPVDAGARLPGGGRSPSPGRGCRCRRRAGRCSRRSPGLALLVEGVPAGVPIADVPSPWPSIVGPGSPVPVLQVPLVGIDHDIEAMYRAMAPNRRVVEGYSGYFPPSWFVMRSALREGDVSVVESLAALGPVDVLLDRWTDRRGRWGRWLGGQPLREPKRSEGRWTLYPLAVRPAARRPSILGARITPAAVSATVHDIVTRDALDGRMDTAWFTPQQVTGDTITIDLGQPRAVGAVRTWHGRNALDYSRGLVVERSNDGNDVDAGVAGEHRRARVAGGRRRSDRGAGDLRARRLRDPLPAAPPDGARRARVDDRRARGLRASAGRAGLRVRRCAMRRWRRAARS